MRFDSIQTLVGDLATWVQDEIKAVAPIMAPLDRAVFDERVQRRAFDIARRALDIIVLEGVKADVAKIPAILESVTIKADAKAALKVMRGGGLLADYVGSEVIILLAPSAGDLFGEPAARSAEVQSEIQFGGVVNDGSEENGAY